MYPSYKVVLNTPTIVLCIRTCASYVHVRRCTHIHCIFRICTYIHAQCRSIHTSTHIYGVHPHMHACCSQAALIQLLGAFNGKWLDNHHNSCQVSECGWRLADIMFHARSDPLTENLKEGGMNALVGTTAAAQPASGNCRIRLDEEALERGHCCREHPWKIPHLGLQNGSALIP